jgi:hypothetical protein
VEKAKQAMLRLVETEMALKAHSRAMQEMQILYQHPGDMVETNFSELLNTATANHLEEE